LADFGLLRPGWPLTSAGLWALINANLERITL
jgi:hypothetical protein